MADRVIRELQDRVAKLEEEMQQLKAQDVRSRGTGWQLDGIFANDPAFEEVKQIIAQAREEDYRKVNEEIDRLEAAESKTKQKKRTPAKARGRNGTAKRTG